MITDDLVILDKNLTWTLRCARKADALELSELRVKIDGETEFLDREPGEGLCSGEDFEKLIDEDSRAERSIFLLAEVAGKIVGFTRCEANKLTRFQHKAEFGICILKEYWGYGIGKILIENVLQWADSAGIIKISLNVVETNTKAIILYKRYGFVEEGLLKKDRIHKDGNYYNTVIMGRIKDSGQ